MKGYKIFAFTPSGKSLKKTLWYTVSEVIQSGKEDDEMKMQVQNDNLQENAKLWLLLLV